MKDVSHWTSYWKTTAYSSSLVDGEGSDAKGFFERWWSRVFEHVFSDRDRRGVRILEIGAGLGVLSLECITYLQQHGIAFQYTALDAADIDSNMLPASVSSVVSYLGSTRLEDAEFSEKTFDVILSQHGFEYCDAGSTLPKLASWLADDGIMAFACHSSESLLYGESLALKSILAKSASLGIFDHVVTILQRMASVGRLALPNDLEAEEARSGLNDALRSLFNTVNPDTGSGIRALLDDIVKDVKNSLSCGDMNVLIERRQLYHEYHERLSDMCAASLEPPQVEAIGKRLPSPLKCLARKIKNDESQCLGMAIFIGHPASLGLVDTL